MATVPYNGFEAGLATEGNPLKYPEGATRDELNFDLLQDGTRRKRLGLEIEEAGQLFFEGKDEPIVAISSHMWDTQVDGKRFIVVQLNTSLYLWPAENNPITKVDPILLYDFSPNITANSQTPESLDFASGNGYLIAVGGNMRPLFFEYIRMDGDTPIINQGVISIRIRDFVGLEDNLDIDIRPGNLTASHRYNLQNQGWEISDSDYNALV